MFLNKKDEKLIQKLRNENNKNSKKIDSIKTKNLLACFDKIKQADYLKITTNQTQLRTPFINYIKVDSISLQGKDYPKIQIIGSEYRFIYDRAESRLNVINWLYAHDRDTIIEEITASEYNLVVRAYSSGNVNAYLNNLKCLHQPSKNYLIKNEDNEEYDEL